MKRKRFRLSSLFKGLCLLIVLAVCVIPFLFMIITSLKSSQDLYSIPVYQLPEVFHFENYAEVLSGNFFQYLLNSLIVVAISVVLVLLVSAMASFSLIRVGFKGASGALGLIIAGMAIPVHVAIVPLFLMSVETNVYDTLFALIGPYVAFAIPMSIFILSDFMRTVPKEMEEAARIDGCPLYKIFFKIFLPLTSPALVTLAIYNAVQLWGEFLFALVLTQDIASRTLPLGIWEFKGVHQANIPMIMTFLTLSSLPLFIVYIAGQERMIKGMMVGSVKE
ncbi:MAG TPA: carbohydrate ABC transporter permease [Candidatus Scatavimonas merdigallinarum]|uniref:Carbohydrate ABC transporter permease n=1 Tax=Candidatus Scatavimonas merdigallinarum TaxID=2840914 RepID=A0A9D1CUX8_9FIRM|nr:carbohydrate ABC transporter permease [Candidatus Scatavimonas merdigallinarum]